MRYFGDHWEYLMVTISIVTFIAGTVIFLYLVPEPMMVGVIVEEYTEKEAIIDTVQEKDVFHKVIRHSLSEG